MYHEIVAPKTKSQATAGFLRKYGLKNIDYLNGGYEEYFGNCPCCNDPYCYIYSSPKVDKSGDIRYDQLWMYCNVYKTSGPLQKVAKQIKQNDVYIPTEGIMRFIYRCNVNFVQQIIGSTDVKGMPAKELLERIGIYDSSNKDTLGRYIGIMGYCSKNEITKYNNGNLSMDQKLPYRIAPSTKCFILPFGPRPGYHTGFAVIYEGIDDIEIYRAKRNDYTDKDYIFFNLTLNHACCEYDAISSAADMFTSCDSASIDDLPGIYVEVTNDLAPINPLKQRVMHNKSIFNVLGDPFKNIPLGANEVIKRKAKKKANKVRAVNIKQEEH